MTNLNELNYMDSIPLFSSRMVHDFIRLIKKEYTDIDVDELLKHAKMELFEVEDEGHWFTKRQMDLFYKKIDQLSTDAEIFRKAGRFFAQPDQNNVLKQYILGSIDASSSFESIEKGFRLLTRANNFKTTKQASNKVEILVTFRPGVAQNRYYCENVKGYLEAISMIYCNKMTQIEHPECLCKEGKNCRYIISWKETAPNLIRMFRNVIACILFPFWLMMMWYDTYQALSIGLPFSIGLIFLLSFLADHKEKIEIKQRFHHLKVSVDQFIDQVHFNYQNAQMTNELGHAMSKQENVDGILEYIVHILKKRLDYDRCVIFLADSSRKWLRFRSGYGYSRLQRELMLKTKLSLDKPKTSRVFASVFNEKKPMIIKDVSLFKGELSQKSQFLIEKLETQSLLVCPIICNHISIGILVVDNIKSNKPLVKSDMSLLMGVASMIGSSIRSADLFAARERLFKSIMRVMAASIDAHDPSTSGHSEKVTEYALGICQEMGLSKDYCDMIQVAALLHDYGKIGVPEAILKKPGKLTPKEFEIVKTHTEKTQNILEQINFEGIFSQVPSITGSHHERYDGTGYPKGLKGKKIPFGARILAVADFFEAVTTKRHYRGPMELENALEILKRETDKHFDKDVVNAFFNYYTKKHSNSSIYRNNTN